MDASRVTRGPEVAYLATKLAKQTRPILRMKVAMLYFQHMNNTQMHLYGFKPLDINFQFFFTPPGHFLCAH
jgi:hypothetical protein